MLIIWLALIFQIVFCQDHKYDQCCQSQSCKSGDPSDCGIPQTDYRNASKLQSQDQVCSEFKDMDVCCNADQNEILKTNFILISYMFGNAGGGCDVCYTNIKRFWCHYTCSPRQSKFVIPDKIIDVEIDGVMTKVLNTTLYVHPKLACQIFQSCSKVQKVTLTSALQSAMGLLNFQGQQSVNQGQTLINMKYIDKPENGIEPLNFRTDKCNDTFVNKTNQEGYIIENSCSCNNCQSMCSTKIEFLESKDPLEGFQMWLVVPLYLSLIVLTIIILYLRKQFKGKRRQSRKIETQKNYLEKIIQQT